VSTTLILIALFFYNSKSYKHLVIEELAISYYAYYFLQFYIISLILFMINGIKFSNKLIAACLLFAGILTLNNYSSSFKSEAFKLLEINYHLKNFFYKSFINFQKFFALVLPLVFTYLFQKRHINSFYGMNKNNFEIKPYLWMLVVMLPMIVIASFSDSFLNTYPRYRLGSAEEKGLISPYFSLSFFEVTYALRFIGVELFWRGLMIIGFVQLFGKRVILPVAALYSVWHFGKPMGEAIGAFFGGYILGVITFRTLSIYGGIIVHYGIALAMDIAAGIQFLYSND
jgi:hypothetical protein